VIENVFNDKEVEPDVVTLYIPGLAIAYTSHYEKNGVGYVELMTGPMMIQANKLPDELVEQIMAFLVPYEVKRRGLTGAKLIVQFGNEEKKK
jgi:hypothetical protein